MNKLTIIGNLTRDPESRTTPNGNNVCTFTVAVNRRRSQNSNQPEADFFRVSVFGVVGENCQRYLAKGRKVAVEGSIQTRSYDAQDGTKRYVTEIIADNVEFLGSRDDASRGGDYSAPAPAAAPAPRAAAPANAGFAEVDDDELPF